MPYVLRRILYGIPLPSADLIREKPVTVSKYIGIKTAEPHRDARHKISRFNVLIIVTIS
jgi:hypothetical protein